MQYKIIESKREFPIICIDKVNGESGYLYKSNKIELGIDFPKNRLSKISNNDLMLLYCDILTHEYMHYLLEDMFNNTVSKLYDIIEKYFRLKTYGKTYNTIIKNSNYITWDKYIKKYGINSFFKEYGIVSEDLIEAKNKCNFI